LRSAESWISDRRALIERRLDRLGEYLARTTDDPDVDAAAGPAVRPSRAHIQPEENR
jgi:hypothetical protein